ncbi:MAG TPA: hypothetical protein VK663_01925, partial [Burkholderiales bacterium]|nr:hypothetical protein [Burkholderiales bacterium]
FGAVSYGLDAKTTALDNVELDDAGRDATRPDVGDHRHTVMLLSNKGGKDQKGIVWTPRFLYFRKYEIPPSTVQKAGDCDVYVLQVYWDRVDGRSKAFDKRHKGGVPQEYAVAVNRQTGLVRVLRMLQRERQKLAHKRGAERTSYIPNPRWEVPSKFLTWASLREDHAPDEYLRRLFIEAALMYETAALGSMIRVEVSQAKLAAVFGVEIKRTAYFFKDRDVTLNAGGTRRRIFHIVKPHRRMTKKGPKYVPMHFRGMKEFEWAGYKVKITVPGRDHIILPEFDVGLHDKEIPGVKYTGSDGLGRFLTTAIREGKGGTNAH